MQWLYVVYDEHTQSEATRTTEPLRMLPTGEWAKMSWKHRLETLVAFNAAGKLPDAQEKALATEMVAAPSVASEDDLARKEAAAERQKERDELRKKSRVVIN